MNLGITVDFRGVNKSTVCFAFCTAVSFGLLCTSNSFSSHSSWRRLSVCLELPRYRSGLVERERKRERERARERGRESVGL